MKRIGGYAGLSQEIAAFSTTRLDAAVAQQVEQLVNNIRFFDLPAFVSGGVVGADLFQYEITITEGERQHTVTFVDEETPETRPLRRLVEAFIRAGR
ncbi:MAG: hypothetical protein FIA90_02250 [candidate division NC10 bacterium]|nr:hypothetical protein [Candidatus Methylomirabilis sp.]NJD67489.1 hypothetical protein [candidate division NC10 bacterium]